jgi:hypothetical protein
MAIERLRDYGTADALGFPHRILGVTDDGALRNRQTRIAQQTFGEVLVSGRVGGVWEVRLVMLARMRCW